MRPGLAVFGILLASALLARDGSAANDPNRWLVGFGKALFWMSNVEMEPQHLMHKKPDSLHKLWSMLQMEPDCQHRPLFRI